MNKPMLTLAAAFLVTAGLAAPAQSQEYPTQTIKMISSFGAGGGSDIIARILAQRMQEKLGQNVIVENRPGAGGVLGNEMVANAPKDGYTLGVQTAGQIIASVITKNMRYDAVGAFDWIGQIATAGLFIVVRPDSPYTDIKSLVAAAKANPGKIVFGSPGFAATQHLAGELFKQSAGIDMLHVPYRTSPEVLAALLSKNVDVVIDTITVLLGPGPIRRGSCACGDRQGAFPDHAGHSAGGGIRRGAELRRRHLVRPVRTEGHAACGGRQAQPDAERDAGGARDPRTPRPGSARW